MTPQVPTEDEENSGGGVDQAQVEAIVADAITDLVDGAPPTLDTLNELATAVVAAQAAAEAAQDAADTALAAAGKRSAEYVFDILYFDTAGLGNDYNSASVNLLQNPASPNIANPFEGSDIVVSASVMLPTFVMYAEGADTDQAVGRSADIAIVVGAASGGVRSWPVVQEMHTTDRLPLLPDPLQSGVPNGVGGYTISDSLEVADSGALIEVDFQDYLTTQPGLPWTLFGYRLPYPGEPGNSNARLRVTVQEV